MERTVIIAKCIGLIEHPNKTLVIFDKPLNSLYSKFIYISAAMNLYIGTLLCNDVVEIDSSTILEVNKYYKITTRRSLMDKWEWELIKQSPEDRKEETVLLWQELGSLVDPPIEAIDLYINELNKRT